MEENQLSYYVVAACRNEEQNIKDWLLSILEQTHQPEEIFIIDDGSTDGTTKIIDQYRRYDRRIHIENLSVKRYELKGCNISLAFRYGIDTALKHGKPEYILKTDVDCILHKNYAKELISFLEIYPELGLVSGYPINHGYNPQSIPDTARLYRTDCLRDYPIIYGHDSFMVHRLKSRGWKIATIKTPYLEKRPYTRNMKKWVLYGQFSHTIGFSLKDHLKKTLSELKAGSSPIGLLTGLLSYLVCSIPKMKQEDLK